MKLHLLQRTDQDPTHFDRLLSWVEQLKSEVRAPKEPFTKREQEIIELIAKGSSSYEIAHSLFISKQTVDTHRKNIYRKGGFRSVRDVIFYAISEEVLAIPKDSLRIN